MLPARGAAYPTLAQKHLNGAVGTSRVLENQTCRNYIHMHLTNVAQEAVIMARWLQGICLGIAAASPESERAQLLGTGLCRRELRLKECWFVKLRLRAAVFVNLVLMRKSMSGVGILMPDENLRQLRSANYLFHSSLNSV